jgi:ferredoxin-type protein NapH
MSIPNRFFKPKVAEDKCLRARGGKCTICIDNCGEGLNPHIDSGMHECSKCGICRDKCPTAAITMPLLPAKPPPKQDAGS